MERLNCQPISVCVNLCSASWEGPVGTPVPGFHRSSTPLFIEYDTDTDTDLQTATTMHLVIFLESHCTEYEKYLLKYMLSFVILMVKE